MPDLPSETFSSLSYSGVEKNINFSRRKNLPPRRYHTAILALWICKVSWISIVSPTSGLRRYFRSPNLHCLSCKPPFAAARISIPVVILRWCWHVLKVAQKVSSFNSNPHSTFARLLDKYYNASTICTARIARSYQNSLRDNWKKMGALFVHCSEMNICTWIF